MCFSATANFVGSGVLGGIGVVTLTRVKHRRELLFAALPTLFAIHQFIEGFVWLGLDGILSPAVAHNMGAAFMLYAQGFLPFLLPLSVFLFEAEKPQAHAALRRDRNWHCSLYFVGVGSVSIAGLRQGKQHRLHQSSDQQHGGCGAVCDCGLRIVIFFADQDDGNFRRGEFGDSADGDGVQALRVYLAVVCVRCDCQLDHSLLLLEKHGGAAVCLRAGGLS
jgi:hypothetical protein